MLSLTLTPTNTIELDGGIRIMLGRREYRSVRVDIDAPKEVRIKRSAREFNKKVK